MVYVSRSFDSERIYLICLYIQELYAVDHMSRNFLVCVSLIRIYSICLYSGTINAVDHMSRNFMVCYSFDLICSFVKFTFP